MPIMIPPGQGITVTTPAGQEQAAGMQAAQAMLPRTQQAPSPFREVHGPDLVIMPHEGEEKQPHEQHQQQPPQQGQPVQPQQPQPQMQPAQMSRMTYPMRFTAVEDSYGFNRPSIPTSPPVNHGGIYNVQAPDRPAPMPPVKPKDTYKVSTPTSIAPFNPSIFAPTALAKPPTPYSDLLRKVIGKKIAGIPKFSGIPSWTARPELSVKHTGNPSFNDKGKLTGYSGRPTVTAKRSMFLFSKSAQIDGSLVAKLIQLSRERRKPYSNM